jgi:serine/threonine protein phosphatase PrpC/predicted ATPase
MGEVHLVEDPRTGEHFALKTLLSADELADDARLLFRQEYLTMVRLQHPNTVRVYEYGVREDGVPFFTMEVVPGEDLAGKPPCSPEELRDTLVQVCQALCAIHDQGFVHGDLKPENLRRRPDGVLKLMDFGLMTRTGQPAESIRGSLFYMAPEVARRGRVDQRADLYSLGALAYHLLLGRPPFVGDSAREVLKGHLSATPIPPRDLRADLPPEIEQVILRLLAKDPQQRPSSAREVLQALGVEVAEAGKGILLTSPLLGRDAEIQRLSAALQRVKTTATSLGVWIVGEAGMGKSRLLEEVRFEAELAGWLCAGGAGHPDRVAPFQIFQRLLPPLIRTALERSPALKHALPILAAIVPDLTEARPVPLEPKEERARLFAAVAEVVQVASGDGLLLFLEDWQWADPLSIELVDYLRRRFQDLPILYVLSSRSQEATGADDRIVLEALDAEATRGMGAAILGQSLDWTLAHAIHEGTRGIPLAIETLLRALVEQGVLRKSASAWQVHGHLDAETMRSGLARVAENRLKGLSPAGMQLARVAAATGIPFGLRLLSPIVGLDEDVFMQALDELIAADVLIRTGDAYQLAQGFERLLYDAIPERTRPAIHGAIAERLAETLPAEPPLDLLSATTRHYLLSDLPEKAVHAALRAGQAFARLFSVSDARYFLEKGLERLPLLDPMPLVELEYTRALGDIGRQTAEFEVASAWYERALPIAKAHGERQANILNSMGRLYQMKAQYEPSASAYMEALELAEAEGDLRERLRALVALGRLKFLEGNAQEALPICREALEAARTADLPGFLSEALGLMGYIAVSSLPDQMDDGMRWLEEALTIRQTLGDKLGLNSTYNLLGNAHLALGAFPAAWTSFEENLRLSREVGAAVDDELNAILNLGITGLEMGRFRETLRHAEEVLARTENPVLEAVSLCLKALAACYLAEPADPLAWLEQARGICKTIKSTYIEMLVLGYAIEAKVYLGLVEEASALAAEIAQLMAESGVREGEARITAFAAEALARRGAHHEAIALAQSGRQLIVGKSLGALARLLKIEALATQASGNDGDAQALLDQALAVSREAGMEAVEAECHLLLGASLLRAGDEAQARQHVAQALELARGTEMPALEALALSGISLVTPGASGASWQANAAARQLQAIQALPEALQASFLAWDERRRLAERGIGSVALTPGFASLQGPRPANEDAVFSHPERGIFLIADGIGGPGKGDVASQLVVSHLEKALADGGPLEELIPKALATANRKVIVSFLCKPERKGMGSTATVAWIHEDRLRLWHVGDSRAYLVRGGMIRRLTEDHTLAQHMKKLGREGDGDAHTLFRCLGKDAQIDFDRVEVTLRPGDRVLLCTDGVHRLFSDDELLAAVESGNDLAEIARDLAQGAIDRGGQDNASVIVLGWQGAGASELEQESWDPLMDFVRAASKVSSSEAIARLALEAALGLTRFERATIVITDQGPWEAFGIDGVCELPEAARAVVAKVLSTGEEQWLLDPYDRKTSWAEIRPAIGIPLMDQAQVAGVLYLDREDGAGEVAEPVRQGLLILAHHCAANLILRRSAERLEARERLLEAIQSLGRAIADGGEDTLLKAALTHSMRLSYAEEGAIYLGAAKERVAALGAEGHALSSFEADEALIDRVLRRGRAERMVEGGAVTEATMVGYDLATTLCVPVRAGEVILGVVYLRAKSLLTELTERDLELVTELMAYAAPMIESARQLVELREANDNFTQTLSGLKRSFSGPARASQVAGDLAVTSLETLIAGHGQSRSTGNLYLRGAHEAFGVIVFCQGEIVACQSSYGGLIDIEALGELLSWKEGSFQFEADPVMPSPPLDGDALVEGMSAAPRWVKAKERVPLDAVPVCLNELDLQEFALDLWPLIKQIDGERRVSDLPARTGLELLAIMEALVDLQAACQIYLRRDA